MASELGCRRQALVPWVLFEGELVGSVTRWPLRGKKPYDDFRSDYPSQVAKLISGSGLSFSSACPHATKLGIGVGPPQILVRHHCGVSTVLTKWGISQKYGAIFTMKIEISRHCNSGYTEIFLNVAPHSDSHAKPSRLEIYFD